MKHLTFSEFQKSNKNKKIKKTNLRKFHVFKYSRSLKFILFRIGRNRKFRFASELHHTSIKQNVPHFFICERSRSCSTNLGLTCKLKIKTPLLLTITISTHTIDII